MKRISILPALLSFLLVITTAVAQDTVVYLSSDILNPLKLASYDNTIYVSTSRLIKNEFRYRIMRFDNGEWTNLFTPEYGYECNDTIAVNDITVDKNGALWVAMKGKLMKWKDNKWYEFVYKEQLHDPPYIRNYCKVTVDSRGVLWAICDISTFDRYSGSVGIYTWVFTEMVRFDGQNLVSVYRNGMQADSSFNYLGFNALCVSKSPVEDKEFVWLALKGTYTDSLLKYDLDGNSYKSFILEDPYVLDNQSRVSEICPDGEGNLWMAQTLGGGTDIPIFQGRGGLSVFNTIDCTWRHYTEKDGLPLKFYQMGKDEMYKLLAVCIDSNGNKWIGGEDGLAMYNDNVFYSYKMEELANIANPNGTQKTLLNCIKDLAVTRDGTLWIANNYALIKFNIMRLDMEKEPSGNKKGLYVFPNPVRKGNLVNFKVNKSIRNNEIFITDFIGKRINPRIVNVIDNSDETIISIDTDDYSSGSHWLVIQGDNEIKVTSFMVY